MSDFKFNRGICGDFVRALNAEYGKGGWWRNLVDDSETFLAIREDSLNIYYRGCSLLELRHTKRGLRGSIHYKYLIKPSLKSTNVTVIDGKPQFGKRGIHIVMEAIADAKDIKKAAKPYAGQEKSGVHHIIHNEFNTPKVLDVEIAFGTGKRVPRIDLAALHEIDNGMEVRFYEAKHFSNPELRTNADKPRVIDQINDYSKLLKKHCSELQESYYQVCCNLYRLGCITKKLQGRYNIRILKSIADCQIPLRINTKPRLLVFGFGADQREGKNWKKHQDKLQRVLGKRLMTMGNPKDLKLIN